MKTYTLDGVIDVVTGESYDEDFPTKQTELLSLSLRQVLQSWKDGEFSLVKAETTDVSGLLDELQSQSDDVVSFCTDIAVPDLITLPAIPDLGSLVSLITTLLPAILSGSLSIGQVVITLLPNIIEALLALIKRDVIRLPTNPTEGNVGEKIKELKEMFELWHGGIDNQTLSDYLSNQVACLDNLGGFQEAFDGIQTATEGINEWQESIVMEMTGMKESLDKIQRWIEEVQAAQPVGIMNTSEIDKVIWVRD